MENEPDLKADLFIDISDEVCPMSFVKTKLALDKIESGQVLELICQAGDSVKNISIQLKDEGHLIKGVKRESEDIFRIKILKDGL